MSRCLVWPTLFCWTVRYVTCSKRHAGIWHELPNSPTNVGEFGLGSGAYLEQARSACKPGLTGRFTTDAFARHPNEFCSKLAGVQRARPQECRACGEACNKAEWIEWRSARAMQRTTSPHLCSHAGPLQHGEASQGSGIQKGIPFCRARSTRLPRAPDVSFPPLTGIRERPRASGGPQHWPQAASQAAAVDLELGGPASG